MNDELQDAMGWLRALPPDATVEQTLAQLRAGVDEDVLWAAGALVATRCLNNQARNLLGFVSHAMIGCEDARRLAQHQREETRQLLLAQALYQVVCDLHDPCFAPYELVPYWPLRDSTLDDNIALLRSDVRFGEYMRADHRLSALAEDMPRAAFVDLLLDIGLEGMTTDDHTLITPVLCLGMIELVGWDAGFDMLRWAVRYSASFPREFAAYDRAVALQQQHGLDEGVASCGVQPERIAALRDAFHSAAPASRPELAARAMSKDGCTPETIVATASLVACDMYLMSQPVPHDDFDAVSREVAPMHINTTMNALRSALGHMSPRIRARAAIQAGSLLERGPSVLDETFAFAPFVPARPYPYPEDVAAHAGSDGSALWATLHDALHAHDTRAATAAAACMARSAPDALIGMLTDVACTDNGTLLHNFKHLHALVEDFRASSHPDRANYLVAAARFVSWYAGKWTDASVRAQACAADAVAQ